MLLEVEGQGGCGRPRQSLRRGGRGHGRRIQARDTGGGPGHGGQQGPHAGGHAGEGTPHGELAGVQEERVPVEELLAGQAGGEAEAGQGALAQVRGGRVRLHGERREGLLARQRARLLGLGSGRALAARAPALLGSQAAGAGRDGGRAVARVGRRLVQPPAVPGPAAGLGHEEVRLDRRAALVPARILRRGGGDFGRVAGLRAVLLFALGLGIALTLAGTQIYHRRETKAKRKGVSSETRASRTPVPHVESQLGHFPAV